MIFGDLQLLDGVLIATVALVLLGVFMPRVRDAPAWRATVTPLASIIGSGFLIVAPVLVTIAGAHALAAMLGIVLLSLWLGQTIAFNIRYFEEPDVMHDRVAQRCERLSDLSLACAYSISIAFYIRLMSGFVLDGLGAFDETRAAVLSTAVLAFIGLYGFAVGLRGLERLEEYSVSIKLSIIAAMLVGLAWHDQASAFAMFSPTADEHFGWPQLRLLAGMLLVVQGFETSKYLGAEYAAPLRIRTMRRAQMIAGVIYALFVFLALPVMLDSGVTAARETAIIGLAGRAARILPFLLTIAAVMSQFSAAIADTIGAGGVVEEEVNGRVSARASYPVIVLAGITLIWVGDIFEVVSLASRAFAFYYLTQAMLAVRLSVRARRSWLITASFVAQSLLLLAVVLFAKAVES